MRLFLGRRVPAVYMMFLLRCDYTIRFIGPGTILFSLVDSYLITFKIGNVAKYYLLTNWFAYLYGRIQSPRPDVMPDRREGITRAAGFVFTCIDTQTS